jgi:hypothetical protein
MRLSFPLSVSLLLLALDSASAQTADDFFNDGARLYIANNTPAALKEVEGGLKAYPDNPKLKKLEALLKKPRSSSSNAAQSSQGQSPPDQPSPHQPSPPQQKSGGGQSPTPQSPSAAPEKPSPSDEPAKQPAPENPSAQKGTAESSGQAADGQPGAAGQMTPEEANRLLDAQKGDEQILQMKPPGKPPDSQAPVKDW